ncbi:MAG: hypothetical protein CVU42_02875 [Chloroflexi bacterium HGW-Chloroflexi-4]|jgi:uncharacterized FlaG/YvyC family protein|nr:MAG: hypothetical protein CVU42_02875 [Chloroflexi bacterium HGW-Chloroflexi-4]
MMPEGKMSVNSVNKVGQVDFGSGPIQVEAPKPVEVSTHGETVQKERPTEQGKAAEQTASAPVLNGDVRLKFIVDAKTNDVTVLVLDKSSRQIIRTIPTDELKNLTRGDLVTIFA